MGNVCAAEEASCFDCDVNTIKESPEKKNMKGCLILKVKKVNINSSKLEEVLMSNHANASQVQMIL